MIATVNIATLQNHIKQYFEHTKKQMPKSKAAMDELTGFASFIIERNQKDIQEFIDNALKRAINSQRTPEINNVFVNRITGEKIIIKDYKTQMFVNENRNHYFFVCKAPHLDGDYSYQCNDPKCKCNYIDLLNIDYEQ